jgi:hypothetical protein
MGEDFFKINGFTAFRNPAIINPEPFLDLKPGDKANQIGRLNKNGKETSSCRVDKFTLLLTYRGTVEYDDEKWICFEIPPEGLSGFDLFHPEEPIFIMYMVFENDEDIELLVPYWTSHGGAIRIHKAVFSVDETILGKKLQNEGN